MKKLQLSFLLLLGFLGVFAQNTAITGIVTSADDGQPIPGVTVLVKGTTNGTITNLSGSYQLTAPQNSTLQFSFVGMETKEVAAGTLTELNVIMETEATGLDEVVVIGYGSIKKKDVTGAVSMVDAKTIQDLKPVKIEQALQGTMAGVNVTTQSGAPGAGLDIRIRGISTNGDARQIVYRDIL